MQAVKPDLDTRPLPQECAEGLEPVEPVRAAGMDGHGEHMVPHEGNAGQQRTRRVGIERAPVGSGEESGAGVGMTFLQPPHMIQRFTRHGRGMHVVNGKTDGGAF